MVIAHFVLECVSALAWPVVLLIGLFVWNRREKAPALLVPPREKPTETRLPEAELRIAVEECADGGLQLLVFAPDHKLILPVLRFMLYDDDQVYWRSARAARVRLHPLIGAPSLNDQPYLLDSLKGQR